MHWLNCVVVPSPMKVYHTPGETPVTVPPQAEAIGSKPAHEVEPLMTAPPLSSNVIISASIDVVIGGLGEGDLRVAEDLERAS